MITCELAVCAETVLRDADRNTVTVVNIMEDMMPEGFPFVIPRLTALFVLRREPGDPRKHQAELTISMGKKEALKAPVDIDFADGTRHRAIITLQGVLLPEPGTVTMALRLKGMRRIPTWQFAVIARGASAGTVQSGGAVATSAKLSRRN